MKAPVSESEFKRLHAEELELRGMLTRGEIKGIDASDRLSREEINERRREKS